MAMIRLSLPRRMSSTTARDRDTCSVMAGERGNSRFSSTGEISGVVPMILTSCSGREDAAGVAVFIRYTAQSGHFQAGNMWELRAFDYQASNRCNQRHRRKCPNVVTKIPCLLPPRFGENKVQPRMDTNEPSAGFARNPLSKIKSTAANEPHTAENLSRKPLFSCIRQERIRQEYKGQENESHTDELLCPSSSCPLFSCRTCPNFLNPQPENLCGNTRNQLLVVRIESVRKTGEK